MSSFQDSPFCNMLPVIKYSAVQCHKTTECLTHLAHLFTNIDNPRLKHGKALTFILVYTRLTRDFQA
jgi:hypothetical protein